MPDLNLGRVVGPQGPQGEPGAQGERGLQGIPGPQGVQGEGVPTGGTTGQVLTKASDANFDSEWADPAESIPTGGTAGQVLTKLSDEDFSAGWADIVPASNPNLLDDWYFSDPINQRNGLLVVPGQNYYNTTSTANSLGQLDKYYKVDTVSGDWVVFSMNGTQYYAKKQYCVSGYIGGYKTYTIDRWFNTADSATTTVEDGFIKVTDTQGNCQFRQAIEKNGKISGNTITVSFLAKRGTSGNVDFGFYQLAGGEMLYGPSKIVSMDDTIQLISVTGVIPTAANSIEFGVYITAGANSVINLYAAKLELSDCQTLAHQNDDGSWVLNDPPPNKATELAKCQRYQVNLTSGVKWIPITSIAHLQSATTNQFVLTVPVPMRVKPTFICNDFSGLNIGGNGQITNVVISIWSPHSCNILIRVNGTGFPEGQDFWLYTIKENVQVILDANL